MPIITLPEPDASLESSLRDAAEGRAWLANQMQVQPLRMLRALLKEIKAIDHCLSVPATRLELLDVLRPAVIQAQAGVAIRYAHKPLPLLRDEQEIFEQARDLWHAFAIAYLRPIPLLPQQLVQQALHRSAVALREVLHCHFIAGIEVRPDFLRLLYDILITAEAQGLQRNRMADPDYPQLSQSTIAGDVTWSFLLVLSDPYRFSQAQFNVANRAFSRWCELASFQTEPSQDRHAKTISLAKWLGEDVVAEGKPQWLDVRPVVRKIRQRVEALQAGETPESLRLGRELTPAGCIRLMRELDHILRPRPKSLGDVLDCDTVDLVFGNENLYLLLAGKPLSDHALSAQSSHISHDRLALFGFDNAANRIDHVKDERALAEMWTVEDQWILRAAPDGGQVVAPLLVGIRPKGEESPLLAVLVGLRQTNDGWLAANVRLFPAPPASALQKVTAALPGTQPARQPLFLLPDDEAAGLSASICLPTGSGLRQGGLLALEESPVEHIRLGEVIERGSNFVRFAYGRT